MEVRSGASETEAEGGAADASNSSAIVPTSPRPEDYLTVGSIKFLNFFIFILGAFGYCLDAEKVWGS